MQQLEFHGEKLLSEDITLKFRGYELPPHFQRVTYKTV